MKQKNLLQPVMLAIAMLFVTALPVQAAGLLTPSNGSLPALEIRDHHVTVVIEDGYAVTTVEQLFHNPHPQDLEAIYSFPVPEHGAVSEFTMWIDGKPVSGEVLEKQEARRIYEEEKQAGREAGISRIPASAWSTCRPPTWIPALAATTTRWRRGAWMRRSSPSGPLTTR
jgi:Ca-activated chloride channel family protein